MSNKAAPVGYVESSQRLKQRDHHEWDQRELLRAAEAAQLPNTGWPIGIVFTTPDLRPVPAGDGIEFRYHRDRHQGGPGWEDFWSFRTDGSYYIVRIFEEEFREPSNPTANGTGKHQLWFDTRVWRIAELLLHSARLYRELGVPPDEPYLLAVNHGGLAKRELSTGDWRRDVLPGQVSHADEARWVREVTQDYVVANLKELVAAIAKQLFALFAFADVPDNVIFDIVDQFRGARVAV